MSHHYAYPRVTEFRRGPISRTARQPADRTQRADQRELVSWSLLAIPDPPAATGR
jgi:hypothetical protein